jgi:hypothetical protein
VAERHWIVALWVADNTRLRLPSMRVVVVVDNPAARVLGGRRSVLIEDAAEAAALARLVVEAVEDARRTYEASGAVHLFLAGPAGLGVLIGQLTNTLGDFIAYEYRRDLNAYEPTASSGRYATPSRPRLPLPCARPLRRRRPACRCPRGQPDE